MSDLIILIYFIAFCVGGIFVLITINFFGRKKMNKLIATTNVTPRKLPDGTFSNGTKVALTLLADACQEEVFDFVDRTTMSQVNYTTAELTGRLAEEEAQALLDAETEKKRLARNKRSRERRAQKKLEDAIEKEKAEAKANPDQILADHDEDLKMNKALNKKPSSKVNNTEEVVSEFISDALTDKETKK